MKAPTSMTKSMGMVSSLGLLEIYIKVTIIWMKEMAMVRCFLQMALPTKETGQEECKQERPK